MTGDEASGQNDSDGNNEQDIISQNDTLTISNELTFAHFLRPRPGSSALGSHWHSAPCSPKRGACTRSSCRESKEE